MSRVVTDSPYDVLGLRTLTIYLMPSDNEQQLTARYLQYAMVSLGDQAKHESPHTACTSGPCRAIQRYANLSLAPHLTRYQWTRETFLQPLKYAYNTPVLLSTNCTPLELVPWAAYWTTLACRPTVV